MQSRWELYSLFPLLCIFPQREKSMLVRITNITYVTCETFFRKCKMYSKESHHQLVLISSQWQVLCKSKLNLWCSAANTGQDLDAEGRRTIHHESSDPNTSKTTMEKPSPKNFPGTAGPLGEGKNLSKSPADKGGHKEKGTLLSYLKSHHINEGSWIKSIHLEAQPRVEDGRITKAVISRLNFPKGDDYHQGEISTELVPGDPRDRRLQQQMPSSGSRCQRRGRSTG